MIVEICASSYQSAENAFNAGAHRIELCSELAIGGVTPSYGLLKKVLNRLEIPVFVLIRPRSGNFVYSEEEFEIIKYDIQKCKSMGCNGIVSGVLNNDFTIDIKRTKELIELSKPIPFTFHRAFDLTPNPLTALEKLIKIGADRILTSGQVVHSEKGLNTLIQLKKNATDRVLILPGGGINENNAHLFLENGFKEIHTSASTKHHINQSPKLSMNSNALLSDTELYFSGIDKIKSILEIVKPDPH